MKQILQNLKTGEIEVADIPVPALKPGHLLTQTYKTLISPGTEGMLLDFGKAGWVNKARQQPDKVRQVLQKVQTDGLQPTLKTVKNKLDKPIALGYSNAGRVVEIGQGVEGYRIGDRVLSNGKHAEIVCVPENLVSKIPENVTNIEASFGVLGSIALHGIRLAKPSLGECFVVQGLGLVGLLAVQILQANGCQVICFDFDRERVKLAESYGAQAFALDKDVDPVRMVQGLTHDVGADGVIICAATKSNAPIKEAPQMCRKRGRVVLIGVVGLNISRDDFFRNEISFQVSCSYGPGRYEDRYEEKGLDYPIGYVRWTENRNFQAVLQLMADGKLRTKDLVSASVPIHEAASLYDRLSEQNGLGYILDYPSQLCLSVRTIHLKEPNPAKVQQPAIAFVGAGNFASGTLIPAFARTDARLKTIVSAGGVSGFHLGRKNGFEQTTTDFQAVLDDPEITAVVITTRHNSHAKTVLQSLEAGKHVFVEKPLCLNFEELAEIQAAQGSAPLLMVGFNRRFAPLIQKMKSLADKVAGPKAMIMTVNAGEIPQDHWTQDPETGGSRLVGEACHFVDLLRFFAGAKIATYHLGMMESPARDTFAIQLVFADGSQGTVHYFANGNKAFPKERLEVFCSGKILSLNNFRVLKGYGWKGFRKEKLRGQDKGHTHEAQKFVNAIAKGSHNPIPLEELFEVTRVSLELDKQRRGSTTTKMLSEKT